MLTPYFQTPKIFYMLFRFVIVLGIACTVYSCNGPYVDTQAEAARLMQISRDWSRVAGTDSVDRILSYWADDATVISPGEPTYKGKQAIRGMVESAIKTPGFKISWEPISATVSKSGDLGYLIEQNQMTFPDSTGKQITVYTRSLTVWRKDANGDWKNVVDISNEDPAKKK